MRMVDLIIKKRNNQELTNEEIKFIIDGYVKGEIPDYQVSSFLMAVFKEGMTDEEQYQLTKAMLESGEQIDLSNINGIKVDKNLTVYTALPNDGKDYSNAEPILSTLVQKFDDVEFSYTGLVRNEDKVFVDGDIEFKSDNFINLLKDTGFSYTPDLPLTSFTVSGKLTGYNNLFELSNANSYLGANKVSGTLALDNTGDKPKLKGNFDIDKLELARWFDFDDRLISNTISNDEAFVSRPKFVENKIDFSDLSKVDFDLKTNIKSLVYNKKNDSPYKGSALYTVFSIALTFLVAGLVRNFLN